MPSGGDAGVPLIVTKSKRRLAPRATKVLIASVTVLLAAGGVAVFSLRSNLDDRRDTIRCPSAGPGETVVVDLGAYAEPDQCVYTDGLGQATRQPVMAGPTP